MEFMRITVKIKPNSKTVSVDKTGERAFAVRVKSPAKEGKANEELIAVLSGYFSVPKSRINVVIGKTGRNKIIDII